MKKLLFLVVFTSVLTVNSYGNEKIKCPDTILKAPVSYFYCVYSDYHNHKYDEGIKKIKKAIEDLTPLYLNDKNQEVPNAVSKEGRLKDSKVYEALSDLHMLLGMFYYQKALNMDNPSVSRRLYGKLQQKGKVNPFALFELLELHAEKKVAPEFFSEEKAKRYKELLKELSLSEEEFNSLLSQIRKEVEKDEKLRFTLMQKALEELQKAIKLNPKNAMAYYQLGNFYSGSLSESSPSGSGFSSAAEEAYYKAALLFKEKGDKEAVKEILKKLQLLNPKSKYLKELRS
ncbi:tetratricopeptide repeat protein [Phorcysia thermohydrogeniphila]|uniref:TPR repeat protein n=1 Tax=Phorcysia thermohydrogeniphila TaxID=936138 RepID=A0A4R1G9V0_9BACT|nr:tetratricopeptide repeat protein [Phorcysia thermohydrogeniphila]TCK03370.1 TPR repeat protein [Phorcysia thermohydrogeniphila]